MVDYNPKTKTLFRRDDNRKVTDEYTDQRYSNVNFWWITEKMDGMSVVITPDEIRGRTPNTQFRDGQEEFLLDYSDKVWLAVKNNPRLGGKEVAVFAELCGPNIHGNSHNFKELRLFSFDITVDGYWLDAVPFSQVSQEFGIDPVPQLGWGNEQMAIDYVKTPGRTGAYSKYFEGVVARSDPYFYDNQGNRIMWKLKCTDF